MGTGTIIVLILIFWGLSYNAQERERAQAWEENEDYAPVDLRTPERIQHETDLKTALLLASQNNDPLDLMEGIQAGEKILLTTTNPLTVESISTLKKAYQDRLDFLLTELIQ